MEAGAVHTDWHNSLFILSPGDRDGLTQIAQEAGWTAIAARRPAGAVQRFLASDALIALVDLRGEQDVERLIAPLAQAIEASGGALVALLEAGDVVRAAECLSAGATHFLASPISIELLRVTLMSARTLADRLGGGTAQARQTTGMLRTDALTWRLDRARGRVQLSDTLRQALELDRDDVTPAMLLRRLDRGERRVVLTALRGMMQSGRLGTFAHAVPGRGADRLVHHLRAGVGAIIADVELLAQGRDRDPTMRDYLTGLYTRQGAVGWIERQGERDVSVILLSLSQFDRMNAAYGQMAGDALLGRIARRIERMAEEVAGPGTLVARVAGTEFLIGLTGEAASSERAIFLARRLIGAIGRPFSAGDHLIRLTARCGIAQKRLEDDASQLIRRAGTALADARQAGGEGIRILSADKRSRQVDADQLETDLRLALDRGEIGIVFQPQYPMNQERISGVEALARWNHPRYGPLGAGILFATAERSDYMLPLSAHIQAEALRQAAGWPVPLSDLRLSINVTAADLAQPAFMPDLLAQVDRSGFPRARLTVEITESGLIEDVDAAAALLTALRDAGLAVAIDDFGTGYSSLAYLKSLPLDYLKIDSGLAQDIAGSARDRIIVRGVIHMAKSLGLKVIAEGVETEQQRDLLSREGCDFYQGFLRSAGIGSEELVTLVMGR
ncbi:bifunctional diguanylate cyclase/phosphodiesterase [Sphingobium aromaticiconvertens]|uniref:putative bifunctional diguanylate cyclase/phosphodiesterase n=1 Tax=Sphingobium aromaticiconvertens TaxID=365341 RepID=UPI00301A8426